MKTPHLIAVPSLVACLLSLQAQAVFSTTSIASADTIVADTIFADTFAIGSVPQELPWDEAVRYQLTIMVQEKLFETTQVGMEVWDLDADSCLFRHNECWRMRPASTQKVVTAIAALDLLGGNYLFKTALRYSGTIVPPPALSDQSDNSAPSDSSDKSSLNFQLSALNPQPSTLSGSLYLVGGMDPLFSDADIRAFADAVKVLGIDTITGSIYEDRTFRDADKWGEGWCWDDDNPNLSPLLVGGKDEAASRLLSALNAVGITVLGGIGQSAAPAATTLVATRTHDLADVLVPMMKRSDNWYAESLFYQIAHQQGGRGAGVKPARSYIDRLVTRAGADQKLIHVADGSGLSLYNYVTPDMEVQLLRYAAKKPEIIEKLLPSLPVAGVDGTLKSRMKGTKAQGNVQAKTGTVTGVSALAGYCTAANGHRLCFSIINMGIPKAKVGRDFQDRVCALLCR
ncbi:MAG: D-alanyl-D-alanine carboxypeptidase/D-alanyl-D-alanine-endopeptidase [Prevotella sp.]|nr:D-alanyl-D-alanine carboxypeptidase/D-alanyl-D-alanine-endopeptidase [Prevotella sp.]